MIRKCRVVLLGLGSEENQPAFLLPSPTLECLPIVMAVECGQLQIIHSRSFQRPIRQIETCRSNDIDRDAEAGGKPQDRSGVARNVRLIERDAEVVWLFHDIRSLSHTISILL